MDVLTNETTCLHFTFVHSTMCKFCGRLQCDLCRKKHEVEHVVNGDKELSPKNIG